MAIKKKETMCKNISKCFGFDKKFERKYYIDDICDLEKNKIIFVLESPHLDEIKAKHPLAGKSGKTLSNFIFRIFTIDIQKICEKIVPLGRLIKDKNTNLSEIGIINVSKFPMQISAYSCDDITKYCEKLKILAYLREHPKTKKYRTEKYEKFHNFVKEQFNERINNLLNNKNPHNKSPLFIPLGKVAREYLNKYQDEHKELNVFETEIIHPARWTNTYIENNLENLEYELKKYLTV